jgi:hypothetical protein
MRYTTTVEAKGYGQPEEEGEKLLAALPDDSPDLAVAVGVDEQRGMLRIELVFDAENGLDAQEQTLDVWRSAWNTAFPDLGPTERIAITAVPGVLTPSVAVGSADPLADVPMT